MSATALPCTSDDIYVVPNVCVLADGVEKDTTFMYWLRYRLMLIDSWRDE